jgi:hypothetical protein
VASVIPPPDDANANVTLNFSCCFNYFCCHFIAPLFNLIDRLNNFSVADIVGGGFEGFIDIKNAFRMNADKLKIEMKPLGY